VLTKKDLGVVQGHYQIIIKSRKPCLQAHGQSVAILVKSVAWRGANKLQSQTKLQVLTTSTRRDGMGQEF
jgi:hypothetical protein